MKDDIIDYVRTGNVTCLVGLVETQEKNAEFQQLLAQVDFFYELYLTVYAHHLSHENKNNILACIQLLIAYGLATPKSIPYELIEGENYCDLANAFSHRLKTDYCVQNHGFQLLNSEPLKKYLDYLTTHAFLKTKLQDSTITKKLEEYQSYLMAIEEEEKKGNLVSFFNKLTAKESLTESNDFIGRRTTLYPMLSECTCCGHERNVREQLEKVLLKQALYRYPPASTAKLTYLSLGSGNLLQDFIIVFKLLKAGYPHINVTLIEPSLNIIAKQQFNFLMRIAKQLQAQVVVNHYKSIDAYNEQTNHRQVQLINCIDFENIFKNPVFHEVMKAHQLLTYTGFFLFSYDHYKLAITKQSITPLPDLNDQDFIKNMFQSAPALPNLQQQTITIALLNQDTFAQWVYLLPMLSQASFESATVFLEHPTEQNYFGIPLDRKNKGFTEENISQFLSLCLKGRTVTVKFIEPNTMITPELTEQLDLFISTANNHNSDKLDQIYQQFEHIKLYFNRTACYNLINHRGIPITIANGEPSLLLSQAQMRTKMDKLDKLHQGIDDLINKIKQLTPAKPAGIGHFFSSEPARIANVEHAVERAYQSHGQFIFSGDEFEIVPYLAHFLTNKNDNQLSIYEAFGYSLPYSLAGISKEQQQLIEFMRVNYHIDITILDKIDDSVAEETVLISPANI